MNFTDVIWNSELLEVPKKDYSLAYFKKIYCEKINNYYTDIINFSFLMICLNFIFLLLNKFFPIHLKHNSELFKTEISFLKPFSRIEIDNYLFLEIAKVFECALWIRIILLFLLERGIA